ncbi:MAG TPA: zinc dependent phospholipase C family protein [Bryobacteraceae bacterium]|nr:zinc dependent phospholipase C family protein [Bryobacteraceae bacterium]
MSNINVSRMAILLFRIRDAVERIAKQVSFAPAVRIASLLLTLLTIGSRPAEAYGLLTHHQLIDQSWGSTIVPILLSRYPQLTPDELKRAHAYAYGGSVIQDLGYYPFSNAFFSDLTHYVRSGDFVRSLFRNSHNANELAFAIGALTHYIGDAIGHSQATNPSVAEAFPKLGAKYGSSGNYAQGKNAHGQVEFAFDINQASKRRLAPYDYISSIGLEIPWDQIATAFHETYGFAIQDILGNYQDALRSYRFGTRRFIPEFTYAEALLHQRRFPDDTPGPQFDSFEQRTARLAQEAEWARYRKNPGAGTHLLAGLIVIMPKVGPIKMLAIKGPTVRAEARYIESTNLSTTALALVLRQLGVDQARDLTDREMVEATRSENAVITGAGRATVAVPAHDSGVTLPASLVPNRDLDTGQRVVPGGYPLTDATYARLLARVTRDPAQAIPEGLKQDIAHYYADPDAPISTKRDAKKWAELERQLEILTAMPVDASYAAP